MHLRTPILWFCFLWICSGIAYTQEICDNGVDDNGNGLVDLNDFACVCPGIGIVYEDVTGKIPNPNFENMTCCPNFISQVGTCLSDWLAPSTATPDYQNTCDFVMSAAYEANIHPFPSGNGVVGIIVAPVWKEYIGACLNSPLEAGQEYEFRIKIAFTPIFMSGNYPLAPNPPAYPPLFFSIYGNESCNNMDMNGTNCPPVMNNNWSEIGASIYTDLSSQWTTLIIRFTPATNMSGFIFGPACNVPQSYQTAPIIPYFWLDDMELYEVEETGSLETDLSGHPCTDDLELVAFGDPPGGDFQWYYNGVAIAGATSEVLYLNQEDYEPGIYQVRYSFGNECAIDTLELFWELPQPSEEMLTVCTGESVVCGGQTYSQPGVYEVALQTADGCDSLVTCIVAWYPQSPPTLLEQGICSTDQFEVCGELFGSSGLYEVTCQDANGCDSLISLQLQVMQPQAYVIHPGPMDCDTTIFSVLDGSLSSEHDDPEGSTSYWWTGPVNGIVGRNDLPIITVHYPGRYCLELTFESFGTRCTDVYCVELEREAVFPKKPTLTGPERICLNKQGEIIVPPISRDPAYAYRWFIPPDIQIARQNDTSLLFSAPVAGNKRICLATENECGMSDTVCHIFRVVLADTTLVQLNTCNPNQQGRDTLFLENALGCDSILIRSYTYVEADTTRTLTHVCSAAEVGRDTLRLSNSSGCDSLVFRHFVLGLSDTTFLEDRRCDITSPSTDTLMLQGLYCDSVIVVSRIPLPSDTLWLYNKVCDPTESGTDTLYFSNRFGCDSLIIRSWIYYRPDTIPISLNTCDPEQVGVQTEVFTNQHGCDSTVITTRILSEFIFTEETVRICGAGMDYIDTLRFAGSSCDSFVYVSYQYFPLDTVRLELSTCDPSQAGMEERLFTNRFGCDSLVFIHKILRSNPPTIRQETTCLQAQSGVFTDTLINSYGCDSLLIREVIFAPLDTTEQIRTTCKASEAGTVVQRLVSGQGCDSIVRIQTNLLPSDTLYAERVECKVQAIYTDTIRWVNQYGCDSIRIERVIPEPEPLSIDLGQDKIVKEGQALELIPLTNGAVVSYAWNPRELFECPTCADQEVFLAENVWISLEVLSANGCKASDSVFVRVLRDLGIFIPDAFTPDGDGINDRFTVYGSSRLVRIEGLEVYDRWGNQLFNEKDLPPNDPRYGWDGSFKGQRMDPAVFVYVARLLIKEGEKVKLSGEVQLIR